MRSALLLAALSLASPARAGVVYDFLTTVEAPRSSTRITGRVWMDGTSFRAELSPDPARSIDVVISTDADRTALFLDVDKKVWVDRVRVNNDVRSSGLFVWPLRGAEVRGSPNVEHRVEGMSDIAGYPATLHVITARFGVKSKVDGAPVNGTIEATARIWITDALPSQPMDRRLRTGYEQVDRKLEAIFAKLSGMIVRHELEVVRTMDGGPPQKELTKTVVSSVEVVDVPADKFAVPAEFAYGGRRAP